MEFLDENDRWDYLPVVPKFSMVKIRIVMKGDGMKVFISSFSVWPLEIGVWHGENVLFRLGKGHGCHWCNLEYLKISLNFRAEKVDQGNPEQSRVRTVSLYPRMNEKF